MIAVREYTSAEENRRNALAIRKRLMEAGFKQPEKPKTALNDDEVYGYIQRIKRLEEKLAEERLETEKQRARAERAELDRADVHAIVLFQAAKIHEMETAGDKLVVSNKKSPRAIIATVLNDYPTITVDEIISARRGRHLVAARHACVKAVYEQRKDLSLPQIGRIFQRDHTTILHAIRKTEATRAEA